MGGGLTLISCPYLSVRFLHGSVVKCPWVRHAWLGLLCSASCLNVASPSWTSRRYPSSERLGKAGIGAFACRLYMGLFQCCLRGRRLLHPDRDWAPLMKWYKKVDGWPRFYLGLLPGHPNGRTCLGGVVRPLTRAKCQWPLLWKSCCCGLLQ